MTLYFSKQKVRSIVFSPYYSLILNTKFFVYAEKAAQIAREAANRWTENIWEMQSYCVNNFGIERSAFDQQFGLKDDFDTV